MNQTKRARILNLIRSRPGIREPEIRDEVELHGAIGSYIRSEIDRGHVLVEKVPLEAGGTVATYRENTLKPLELDADGGVAGRKARAPSPDTLDGSAAVDIAVSAAGVTTISKGGKSVVLTPADTQRVVAYLDRINIDQILADALQ
ncbi:hypothetical protein WJ91_01460 [Burkholderia ubonensis]|uniref:hypothetical protein n=1 Tax=Burkholderia ubonensis TaxID=101571 RepID=UPI000755B0BC|nr:hypothetical protein [Burkholderia ubonensis]KVP51493.1 hypothetical protein WJ91_01460 [Burkholderia ubonensis]